MNCNCKTKAQDDVDFQWKDSSYMFGKVREYILYDSYPLELVEMCFMVRSMVHMVCAY